MGRGCNLTPFYCNLALPLCFAYRLVSVTSSVTNDAYINYNVWPNLNISILSLNNNNNPKYIYIYIYYNDSY